MSFKFEFEHFDGKKVKKLLMEGRDEFAHEAAVRLQKHINEIGPASSIVGIALGPEEYLGIFGVIAKQNRYSEMRLPTNGKIDKFMGHQVFLKDQPGIDLLIEPSIPHACMLTDKFKILLIKEKKKK